MPIRKVQTPAGIVTIEAPEGATDAQIMQFAKIQYYEGLAEKYAKRVEPRDPTAGMSGPQKFFAGMGKSVYDTGRGVGNLFGLVSDDELAASRELDSPLMETGAGLAGNIAGHVGQVLTPGALLSGAGKAAGSASTVNLGRELMAPTTFKTGAGLGAGYGYIQPGTQQERMAAAGLGGVGGGAGGWLGGKLGIPRQGWQPPGAGQTATVNVAPTARATGGGYTFGHVGPDAAGLSEAQKAAKKAGVKMGFKMTPGRASGSKALQQMEAKLESQPMTSAPFNAIKEHNQRTLNQIAARSIGQNADELSSSVLDAAKTNISDTYKIVADDTIRQLDADEFLDVLGSIDDDMLGILDDSIMDDKLVSRLFSLAEKGQATGKQLQQLTSKLGHKAAKQMTTAGGDRDLGISLFRVKNYVDEKLAQGLDDATKAAFTEARDHYRNLMLLTQRVGTINPASGNIQGGALANMLQQKDRPGYLFGGNQGDLFNAARFAQAFKPIVGDSGTATRSALPSATDIALSAPFNVATHGYLAFPNTLTFGGHAVGRAAPMAGLLGGGMIGREMY